MHFFEIYNFFLKCEDFSSKIRLLTSILHVFIQFSCFYSTVIILHIGTNHLMGDSDTKFKEDHLVLPVATPLPHHSHNSIKSGYQHDVLNSSGLQPTSIGASDGSAGGLQSGLNGSSTTSGLDKYGDMSSLHLAHNRFLMPSSASDPMKASDMHHFTTSATNPFSIHR